MWAVISLSSPTRNQGDINKYIACKSNIYRGSNHVYIKWYICIRPAWTHHRSIDKTGYTNSLFPPKIVKQRIEQHSGSTKGNTVILFVV